MAWIIAIVVLMIISMLISSAIGKIAVAAGIIAIVFLLLSLVTGISFFITLSKLCLIVIIIDIAIGLLRALFMN